MIKRIYDDWLTEFVEYAAVPGEAPKRMYFWAGVSAIAGALRRKVWIEQFSFRWYPNFYIVFVAPPGVVSKSTTVDVAIKLLRAVPGIKFGPDVVTWQSLVQSFAEAGETFLYNDEHHQMSAMTLEASEFGNLLNPQDREMVDIYVRLWDAKESPFEKKTKHSGNDTIYKPWINMIACTTPAWIAGNFPEYMIGGGFTSRCVFVFADKKDKLVAYPDEVIAPLHLDIQRKLINDLEHIATSMVGQFIVSAEAREFGRLWYSEHYKNIGNSGLDTDRFGGYLARKQTIIHKLAMILSASRGNSMIIEKADLALANTMVTDLEPDMAKVFERIGQTPNALVAERLVTMVTMRGQVPYSEAFRYVHAQLPSMREFDDIVSGCIRAGLFCMGQVGTTVMLSSIKIVPQQVPGDNGKGRDDKPNEPPEELILPVKAA